MSSKLMARRRLDFGGSGGSLPSGEQRKDALVETLRQELALKNRQLSEKYGFDFVNDRPLPSSAPSSSEYVWRQVSAADLPEFYTRPYQNKPYFAVRPQADILDGAAASASFVPIVLPASSTSNCDEMTALSSSIRGRSEGAISRESELSDDVSFEMEEGDDEFMAVDNQDSLPTREGRTVTAEDDSTMRDPVRPIPSYRQPETPGKNC